MYIFTTPSYEEDVFIKGITYQVTLKMRHSVTEMGDDLELV